MCTPHYNFCVKGVARGETTWEELNEEFPERPFSQPQYREFSKIVFREAEFLNSLVSLIQRLGHRSWILDAPPGARGVPDLLVITKENRVLFREIKSGARASKEQEGTIKAMKKNGVDADFWTPSDLSEGRVERELRGDCQNRNPAGANLTI